MKVSNTMIPVRNKRENADSGHFTRLNGLTTFYIVMSLLLTFVFADSGSREIYILILVFILPALVGLAIISLDALRSNIE